MNPSQSIHDVVVDTAKASLPIGGGVAMQYVHVVDEVFTLVTHAVGAASAVLGFWWLIYRIRRDFRSQTKTVNQSTEP